MKARDGCLFAFGLLRGRHRSSHLNWHALDGGRDAVTGFLLTHPRGFRRRVALIIAAARCFLDPVFCGTWCPGEADQ